MHSHCALMVELHYAGFLFSQKMKYIQYINTNISCLYQIYVLCCQHELECTLSNFELQAKEVININI